MKQIIVTKSFQKAREKVAQQQKYKRFWGEAVISVFVPLSETDVDPSDPVAWKSAYQAMLANMKGKAELALREVIRKISEEGTSGQTDPDVVVTFKEYKITGTD